MDFKSITLRTGILKRKSNSRAASGLRKRRFGGCRCDLAHKLLARAEHQVTPTRMPAGLILKLTGLQLLPSSSTTPTAETDD